MIRRFLDIVTALPAIILLAPTFLILFVIIKIKGTGPALTSALRIGRHEKMIRLFRFNLAALARPTDEEYTGKDKFAAATGFARFLF